MINAVPYLLENDRYSRQRWRTVIIHKSLFSCATFQALFCTGSVPTAGFYCKLCLCMIDIPQNFRMARYTSAL